jgi:hypothetical protein
MNPDDELFSVLDSINWYVKRRVHPHLVVAYPRAHTGSQPLTKDAAMNLVSLMPGFVADDTFAQEHFFYVRIPRP